MSSLLDYGDGARFTLRVRSSLASNRRVRWHNTYEFRATEGGDVAALLGLAGNVGSFHTLIQYNYVYTDEVTISTWEADSHPYNPLGFTTLVVNVIGSVPLGVKTPVSLRQTLFVKRMCSTGLPGKLFLRGALSNEDIEYADGEWQLSDPEGMQSDLHAATLSSHMSDYLLGVESVGYQLCLISPSMATRSVDALAVASTSDIKLNHKYFDRS